MQWVKENRWLIPCFLVLVSLALAYRLLTLTDLYAVNLLFMDQWDFYTPLFRNADWLTMFRWQHGPHRQGVGLFVTKAVAELTGWNTRAESFAVCTIVLAALALAFLLKKRLWGQWSWWDVALPLIFLTPVQFESFYGTPNPAHSALPLFLLMLYCLAWLAKRRAIRYGGITIINFLMLYTGFGVFIGLLTPVFLAAECLRTYRERPSREFAFAAAAFVLSLCAMGSFFVGYIFSPATDHFQAVHPRLWEYPWFAALMLSHFLSITIDDNFRLASVVGAELLVLAPAVGIFHARQWMRNRSEISLIITILMSFSLLYCLDTAYGRVSLGLEGSQAPRYATLLIAAFLGLYFHGLTLRAERVRKAWLIVTLAALAWGGLIVTPTEESQMAGFHDRKLSWKTAYLETGSIEEADRRAGIKVYPNAAVTHLAEKLDYLRRRRLNLFRDPN